MVESPQRSTAVAVPGPEVGALSSRSGAASGLPVLPAAELRFAVPQS